MGYAKFSTVRDWVQPGYGECSPDVLAEVVNASREHMYSWYEKLPLFLDAIECFKLQTFCVECNSCSDTYRGVTLPRDFLTPEAIWWQDWPLTMRSEWREWQMGISPQCDCRLQKFDVPGRFPTAIDLVYRHPKKLRALCLRQADAGKKLKIRGINAAGVPYEYQFTLTTQPQDSPEAFRSIERRGGVLKDATLGRVVLSTEDDRLLCIYEADETIPAYRRIKITGTDVGCPTSDQCINIRAARTYYPLSDDDDVVESDNRMVFDAMARYLRLNRKHDKSSDDLRAEKDHLATARGLMLGTISREQGTSTRADVRVSAPHLCSHSRLNRMRGGYLR